MHVTTVTAAEETDCPGHANCVRFTMLHATLCNMDPNELGRRIKAAREQKHWTQQELADKVDVSVRSVINWEQGTPPRNRLGALERVLGVNLRDSEAVDIPVQQDGQEITVRISTPASLSEEGRLRAEAAARGAAQAVIAMESGDSDPDGQ